MFTGYTRQIISLILSGGFLLFQSCQSNEWPDHPVYDLRNPTQMKLPPELDEVSGIAYDPSDSGLFAVADERGTVYKLIPGKSSPKQHWELAPKGDFEDLALVKDVLWLLRSDGRVQGFRLPLHSDARPVLDAQLNETGNDFETLLPEASGVAMLLICKDCPADKKNTIGSRELRIVDGSFQAGRFALSEKLDAEKKREKKTRFHPSAAVREDARGIIMVLSTNPSCLLETTSQGHLLARYELDPSIYNQPEGIALGADGTLYITTEAGHSGSAKLLEIPPRSKKARK